MAKTCTIIKAGRADTYGRPLLVGQSYTGPDDEVFSLWQSGFASVAGAPGAFMPATQIQQFVIAQSNTPFFIMHGDGAANGCQFTGSAGAFTVSAAIVTSAGSLLSGCYAYLSANFGGSSRPAGWYWCEFSSDTAGILYANQYTGGPVRRPSANVAFSENLTGWVTGPTTEITIANDILLPGTALGKNGRIRMSVSGTGTTTGTKSYRLRDASTNLLAIFATTTTPSFAQEGEVFCIDSDTVKRQGRIYGTAGTVLQAAQVTSLSTAVDQLLSISIQSSSNMSAAVLDTFMISAIFA